MYILKNAVKSIVRNKGRNIMIMIIALIISIAACVSLSIREAAQTAKEDSINNMSITAQLTYDRSSVMESMKGGSQQSGFDRGSFDFKALSNAGLTLDEYMEYAKLLGEDDSYYYALTLSLNAAGDILPYGTEETDTSESAQTNTDTNSKGNMSGFGGEGGKGFSMKNMSTGDFSLTGYSSYQAVLSMFGEDGTYTISDGTMFDETSDEHTCIISNELALYNDLAVGDVITLSNPDFEDETYDLTISGIYTNEGSSSGNSRFSRFDPANNIYMNSAALQNIIDLSASAGNTVTDDAGEETDASLKGETNFTYVLSSAQRYETFKASSEAKGLPENYIISSYDLASYENSLTPLNTLSQMTGWFFLIVLIIGGVILVVLNMFNLRERKYEVGVLTAIGMKKIKVMTQFVCELFIITFTAIVIGSAVGAAVSVPVTNTLLEQQAEKSSSSEQQLNNNFGFEEGKGFGTQGMSTNHGANRFGAINTSSHSAADYITSVSSATDLTVVLQMILVGALLTVISSIAALITIMRYEPLQILSDRS